MISRRFKMVKDALARKQESLPGRMMCCTTKSVKINLIPKRTAYSVFPKAGSVSQRRQENKLLMKLGPVLNLCASISAVRTSLIARLMTHLSRLPSARATRSWGLGRSRARCHLPCAMSEPCSRNGPSSLLVGHSFG